MYRALHARLKGQAVSRELLNLPHQGRATVIGVRGTVTLVTRVALGTEVPETQATGRAEGGGQGRPSQRAVLRPKRHGLPAQGEKDRAAAACRGRKAGSVGSSGGVGEPGELAAGSGAEEASKRLRPLTDLMREAALRASVAHEKRRGERATVVLFGRLRKVCGIS